MTQKTLNRILLVDDDETTNFVNERALRKHGVAKAVDVVLDGQKAITYLKKLENENLPPPEIILLDINMPVMDGYEFIEELQSSTLKSKLISRIIMLSSSSREEDICRSLQKKNVIGYLEKPFSPKSMDEILSYYYSERI